MQDVPYKSFADEADNNPLTAVGMSCDGGTRDGKVAPPRGRKVAGLGGSEIWLNNPHLRARVCAI